jgi:hypothetical protein
MTGVIANPGKGKLRRAAATALLLRCNNCLTTVLVAWYTEGVMNRRLKLVYVDARYLGGLISGEYVIKAGLPKDAQFVRFDFDILVNRFRFVFTSSEFPEVKEGDVIPEFVGVTLESKKRDRTYNELVAGAYKLLSGQDFIVTSKEAECIADRMQINELALSVTRPEMLRSMNIGEAKFMGRRLLVEGTEAYWKQVSQNAKDNESWRTRKTFVKGTFLHDSPWVKTGGDWEFGIS